MKKKYSLYKGFLYNKFFLSLALFSFYTCYQPGGSTTNPYRPPTIEGEGNLTQKQKEQSTLQEEVDDLKTRKAQLKASLKDINNKIEKLRAQKAQEESVYEEGIKKLEEKKSRLQANLDVLNTGISKLETFLKKEGLLKDGQKLSDLPKDLKGIVEKKLNELRNQITQLENSLNSLNDEILKYIDHLKEAFKRLRKGIETSNEQIDNINQSLKAQNEKIQKEIGELNRSNEKIKDKN